MKISIVIVNYNVKYFIEQCLLSIERAIKNIEAEVFVVDNNSVDGSCALIHQKFPWVKLIENHTNVGFSKANNQAIKQANGEYILVLNPDTVIDENCLEKIIEFADKHPDAGGIGVKMIDGRGKFLPESKRGLPTPLVAFYKIFGLSSLFPKSKIFSKYHLGYLNKDQIHTVDVLAGAFMLLRKKVLDVIGLLDEDYFMYGEDIDLSYRITKAGYKNYYYPETTIIHYKGESTKKGSINYVLVFYNAMIIFAQKHFSKQNAKIYSLLIKTAVYFRALLSILKRVLEKAFLPAIDALIIISGFHFIVPIWEIYKFSNTEIYPEIFLQIIVPLYCFIWIGSIYFSNGYKKPIRIIKILRGIAIGSILILSLYSLLPENLRFSRALILIGTLWTLFSTTLLRYLLHKISSKRFALFSTKKKRVIIVGNIQEANRVLELLSQSGAKLNIVGNVNPKANEYNDDYIGNLSQLKEIIRIHHVDEIIFCSKNLESQVIINTMLSFSEIKVDFKIAPQESISVIGSNSIHTSGELYLVSINSINSKPNRIKKKCFDIVSAILIFCLSPILFLFQKNRKKFYVNLFDVLLGRKTWVGYHISNSKSISDLPHLKPGILSTLDMASINKIEINSELKINTLYAKNFSIMNDFRTLILSLHKLGRE